MRTKRKGGFLMALGLLLVLGAIGLAVWNMQSELSANEASNQALQALVEEIPESESSASPAVPVPEAEGENLGQEEVEIPDYVLNPEMDMPEKNIYGWNYIGVLDIPALGLSLPIMSTWSYPALNVAPCRFMGSAYTDDLIIAAHNYACHFGQLKNLPEGSTVVFTDVDGNRFEYLTVLTETLQPTAVEEMCAEEWDLSLFTCTVGGQYRVTVRCEKIE